MAIEGVPETMLAAQVVEYNKPYKIHSVPTPTSLSPHDLLLRTAVASLCHTDSMVSSGAFSTSLPCTASHEGSGTVIAVGSAVTGFALGDRVMAGLPFHSCGHCGDCLGPEELQHYCHNVEGYVGLTLDGAFAEFMLVDSRQSCVLPEGVGFETAAPLACAGISIWGGLLRAGLKKGETVALVGAGGGLGHLGCQFGKALGLQVVGIDARDEGLTLARESGATVVVDARKGKEKVVEEVKAVTEGLGVDAAICISDAEDAAGLACAVTRMHGLMVQIAQPTDVSVPFAELIFRDIRIHGSLICSPIQAREMLDVVAKHNITVKANTFYGLEEVPKLIELAHSGKMAGKGVVIIDEAEMKRVKEKGVS